MTSFKLFMSESGDWFKIPTKQFESDTAAYRKAVDEGNETIMLHFEIGRTGWIYTEAP